MRNLQLVALIFILLALVGCKDDGTSTDPVVETVDIAGSWAGEKVVQCISPVNHLLAVKLWGDISSADPPLTIAVQCTQNGNDITVRITDEPSGYYIEYTGTISGEEIQLTSTIVSYPPLVTRVTCSDGTDRHYAIQTSTISAIVHEGIFTGNIVTTSDVLFSESGLPDGEIVYDHTFNLTRTQ